MFTDSVSCLKDLPVVLISFDEPNLQPTLEVARSFGFSLFCHSHGIHGFDAAHKAAAALVRKHSDSHWFVTIDGDNTIIHSHVWEARLFDVLEEAGLLIKNTGVVSFRAINSTNRACYGNGGVKVWSHDFVTNMVTHEAVEGKPVIDFCWSPNYVQMANVLSHTNPNGSPYQAFRAGYREGVKLMVGVYDPESSVEVAHKDYGMFTRVALGHWATLGLDVPNGDWSVLGTLAGLKAVSEDPVRARSSIVSHDRTLAAISNFIADTFDVADIEAVSSSSVGGEIIRLGKFLVEEGMLEAMPFGADRSKVMRAVLIEAQQALLSLPLKRL